MRITAFDHEKWNLQTFKKIGYDHEENQLYIFYFNGSIVEFSGVEECIIFEFILSLEKEKFIKNVLCTQYFSRVIYQEASLSG